MAQKKNIIPAKTGKSRINVTVSYKSKEETERRDNVVKIVSRYIAEKLSG